jgi:antitoxin VapB
MSLNIKNEEAHRLASRLARLTGESLTEAVTRALRERLERVEAPNDLARQLLDIGRDCAERLSEPYRSVAHGDLLYDERGLPR